MACYLLDDGGEDVSEIGGRLGLALCSNPPENDYYLCREDGVWLIRNQSLGRRFKIQIQLKKRWELWGQQQLSFRKDLLAKALGLGKAKRVHVFDGSMGFAEDSLHMLALGAKVTACEIQTVIHF